MKRTLFISVFCIFLFHISMGQITYKYDSVNRLVQVSSDCTGTKYGYDANGNRTSVTVVSIKTIYSLFDERCGKDGQILITAQDLSAHYQYLWSNGKTTAGITNLPGGSYSVVITEPITGFTCNQSFTIKGIFKDSIAIVPQQIVCNGANNGKARIKIVTPDTLGSYLYHWSTITDTAYTSLDSLTDLKPGTYSVSIRNNKRNCIKTINFTITEPPSIITKITKNDASCPSVSDGNATVEVNGDPANYTFAWTGPFQGTLATPQVSGLPVGNYTLTVTQKETLCALTQSMTIGATLTEATINADGPTTFFDGKGVILSANTAPSYLYQWSKNGTPVTGATTSSYMANEGGLYTVQITANNCTLISAPTTVIALPVDNFTVSTTDETCRTSNNGSIDITAKTSLQYKVTISGTNIATATYPLIQTLHIGTLSAGNYTICIKVDSQDAYKQCYDLVIGEPKDLAVLNVAVNNIAKTITMSLNGGVKYNIEINGQSYTTTESDVTLPMVIGHNKLRITADNLCQGVYERDFILSNGIIVFPNPFDRNITISLGTDMTKRVGVKVYNVTGNIVYSNVLNNEGGFITANLPNLIPGVYSLKLSISNQIFKITRK
ncbi:MAG TPA: T9SS type A sorting domain-containing protein [Mucilaginibacter sp.]|nr:T9SS type A sorting domain-containing protein [Mucilaginibacter sp.]